jgi:hypothetical protein
VVPWLQTPVTHLGQPPAEKVYNDQEDDCGDENLDVSPYLRTECWYLAQALQHHGSCLRWPVSREGVPAKEKPRHPHTPLGPWRGLSGGCRRARHRRGHPAVWCHARQRRRRAWLPGSKFAQSVAPTAHKKVRESLRTPPNLPRRLYGAAWRTKEAPDGGDCRRGFSLEEEWAAV